MATVIPLTGTVYNQDKIKDMAEIVTPPYDVISPQEEDDFIRRHPNNMIHLILGKSKAGDNGTENCHTRAGRQLGKWRADGILVDDEKPAFYLTSTEFELDGKQVTRLGLTGLVALEPFEKGVVLPHERTFSKVRSERLERTKACQANLSAIFALYADNGDVFAILEKTASSEKPCMDFIDRTGQHQKMWRITGPSTCSTISGLMNDKKIFIADGHHRYETALAYQEWLRASRGDLSPDDPANHVLMYLTSTVDPGLVIRPAHRLLHGIPETGISEFTRKAGKLFDITTVGNEKSPLEETKQAFVSALETSPENTFGACLRESRIFYLLSPKPGIVDKMLAAEIPEVLRSIDVTVLTRLLLMDVLGYDRKRLDNEKMISYTSVSSDAIDFAVNGKCDIAVILNPTRMDQVKRVAEEGLIMPRKATYFYPKVITGQVLYML